MFNLFKKENNSGHMLVLQIWVTFLWERNQNCAPLCWNTELPKEQAGVASTRRRTFETLNCLNEEGAPSGHEEFLAVRARGQSSCDQDAMEGGCGFR